MKIIKEGPPPVSWTEVRTCDCCKTVFSYTNEDLTGYFDDGGTWNSFVQCPKCKDRHNLTTEGMGTFVIGIILFTLVIMIGIPLYYLLQ